MRNAGQDSAPLLAARTASWKRVAVVLSPFAYRHVLRGKRHSSAIVNALLNALEEWCSSENFVGIAFPYLWEHEDACLLSALRSRGALVTLLGAGCALSVTWQNPGDYFRWLGRRTIRQAFERTPSAEHRRTRLLRSGEPLNKELRTDARHLMEWSAQRHGYRIPPSELYEQMLAEWPDERFLAWIDNPEGPVESFALAFIYNDTVMPKFGCHRYKTGEYFNLCFTEMIVHAIEQKHALVDFGASNHQAKLLRGGQIYWIAGAILTLDKSFTKKVIPGLDAYSSVILSYISELSSRYSVDHRVPPLPGWMGN